MALGARDPIVDKTEDARAGWAGRPIVPVTLGTYSDVRDRPPPSHVLPAEHIHSGHARARALPPAGGVGQRGSEALATPPENREFCRTAGSAEFIWETWVRTRIAELHDPLDRVLAGVSVPTVAGSGPGFGPFRSAPGIAAMDACRAGG